jgi:ABC-type dipeptide/oligopeptide/nickel transport system permease subunit
MFTAVAVLFATLSFCGLGPMPSLGGRISFGLGFLVIAFVVWRSWRFIVGDFSPAIMDTFTRRHLDPDTRDRDEG